MKWPLTIEPATRQEAHYGDRIITCFAERPLTLVEMLDTAIAKNPDGESIICGDARLSWADVDREVNAVAAGLAARGVQAGDRVALLLGNHVEFVLALYACFRLGAIAVPLSTRYQTPEIAFAVNNCGASVLLFDAALAPRMPEASELPEVNAAFYVGEPESGAIGGADPWDALRKPGGRYEPGTPVEEDTAVILYTSGTTGRPKGAMLTHLSIVNSSLVFCYCLELTEADRSIAAVPLTHVTGLVANILSMTCSGGALIIMPAFKASDFIALAERERVTHTVMVPAMYKLCLMTPGFAERDLSSWRIGGFGGAPMPEPTIHELAQVLPNLKLVNAYGATETTSPTTVMPSQFGLEHSNSVGLAAPNCNVIVVDDQGVEVPRGTSGEIWIGGPSVVSGYWNRPDANAESFTAGFWHSGDIGMMDEDGFVHVLDRKKDMISRGGLKIYSAEVESVLSDFPGVVEIAIVARICPVLGERVHAFVTINDEAVTAEGLTVFAAARLSDYKVPESFTLSGNPLPRNSNGKVLKRMLRDQLEPVPLR